MGAVHSLNCGLTHSLTNIDINLIVGDNYFKIGEISGDFTNE
jgi:hypothetical protein